MLLERGASQPRSLANAFRRAVRMPSGTDVLQTAVDVLLAERTKLMEMYGSLASAERTVVATTVDHVTGVERASLPDALAAILKT